MYIVYYPTDWEAKRLCTSLLAVTPHSKATKVRGAALTSCLVITSDLDLWMGITFGRNTWNGKVFFVGWGARLAACQFQLSRGLLRLGKSLSELRILDTNNLSPSTCRYDGLKFATRSNIAHLVFVGITSSKYGAVPMLYWTHCMLHHALLSAPIGPGPLQRPNPPQPPKGTAPRCAATAASSNTVHATRPGARHATRLLVLQRVSRSTSPTPLSLLPQDRFPHYFSNFRNSPRSITEL